MVGLKKAIALILSLAFLFLLTACKASYQDAVIYYEIPEKPRTLDPQIASTDAELSLVRNLFEGLLRKNQSNAIVCGVADSFEYHDLTYTFRIREDAVWSDKKPVTANDFVFAFRRSVDPATKAPFGFRLKNMVNAESILQGKMGVKKLGVSAKDDKTLVIRMAREDENFKNTLTTSVSMPCREDFFATCEGQYGLETERLLFNGSYRLAKWSKDPFDIRLYKNGEYNGSLEAKNSAVFVTRNDKKSTFDRLSDNNVDIAFVDSSLAPQLEKKGLKTAAFEDVCWVLTLSPDFSPQFRKAFAASTGDGVYGKSLPAGCRAATSLYPPEILKESPSDGMTAYDLAKAQEAFGIAIEQLADKKFPSGVKLTYYDNAAFKSVVTDIVGHWQNQLGAFVNIEATTDNLAGQLQKQTLSMSIFPYKVSCNEISEYLRGFGIYGQKDPVSAQVSILEGQNVIPIAFQNTTISYAPTLGDLFVEPQNGYIDFAYIVKVE